MSSAILTIYNSILTFYTYIFIRKVRMSMNKSILKENRIHGDSMFPFSLYSMNCTGGDILDCHWHDELEFLIVTSGKATFQVDTSYYDVYKGQAIFINSGDIHAGYSLDSSACSYSALVFSPDLLLNGNLYDAIHAKYISPILHRKYMLPAHIKGEESWEREILNNLLQILSAASARNFTYELYIKARFYDIFSSMLINANSSPPQNKDSASSYKIERLKTILEYIHSNYNRKISLKDLAARHNMSEGYFCRFFKQMIRKTPVDYINSYRVNMAAKLLMDDSRKVIQIGIDVGFENNSYFISTFKHYMNCTPSEYRKIIRADINVPVI